MLVKSKKIETIRFRHEDEVALCARLGVAREWDLEGKNVTAYRKMKKEWFAAKVAEINARPNLAAKIVGKGSYMEIAVYQTLGVASRIQFRGTCQACGRSQAVEGGRIVLHGYERPGDGYTVGRCGGTGHEPAEKSVRLTESTIAALRMDVERFREIIVGAGYSLKGPDSSASLVYPEGVHRTYIRQQDEEINTMEKRATILRASAQMAIDLETYVLPKFGQPLVEVEVEA